MKCNVRPLFRVPTRLATAAHLVPSSSTALKRRSSSSALHEPFETRVAIWAHHRFRQSLLVRLGMCFAMACHLDGGLAPASSAGEKGHISMDDSMGVYVRWGQYLSRWQHGGARPRPRSMRVCRGVGRCLREDTWCGNHSIVPVQ